MNDEGQFESAASAVAFALNFSGGSYQRPLINRLATPSAMGNNLGGLDRAAQVGMIRAEMAKMGVIPESFLIASKAPHKLPCSCGRPCCTKSRPNTEWQQAIHLLVNHTRDSLGLCAHNYNLRKEIIFRYFSEQIPISKIATTCHVNRDTASVHTSQIYKALKKPEHQAWEDIEIRLSNIGMLEKTETT